MSVRGRRAGAAAAAAVLSLSILGFAAASTGPWSGEGSPYGGQEQSVGSPLRGGDWFAATVRQCQRARGAVPDQLCTGAAWHDATAAGPAEVASLMDGFDLEAARDPAMEIGCHEEAHVAGRDLEARAGGQPGALQALLSAVTRDHGTCDNGVLHGVMDSYAHRRGNSPELLSRHCESLREPARDACTHGLGHAAWQATHGVADAVAWCLLLAGELDQERCAIGVAMQMYRPDTDGSRPAELTASTLTVDLPRVCGQFRQSGATAGMQRACLGVAAGELAGLALPATRDWLGTPGPGKLQAAAAAWTDSLRGCAELGQEVRRPCADVLVQLLALNLLPRPGAQAELCARLPAEYVERCASQAASFG